nr:enoyl-CoA hydratase-related protein [Nocardia flavorosea]
MVNRLAEPGHLLDTALDLAGRILAGAPLSVRAARETVMLATEMGRTAALAAARHAASRAYRSADAREGPAAFAQKRPPHWTGT